MTEIRCIAPCRLCLDDPAEKDGLCFWCYFMKVGLQEIQPPEKVPNWPLLIIGSVLLVASLTVLFWILSQN